MRHMRLTVSGSIPNAPHRPPLRRSPVRRNILAGLALALRSDPPAQNPPTHQRKRRSSHRAPKTYASRPTPRTQVLVPPVPSRPGPQKASSQDASKQNPKRSSHLTLPKHHDASDTSHIPPYLTIQDLEDDYISHIRTHPVMLASSPRWSSHVATTCGHQTAQPIRTPPFLSLLENRVPHDPSGRSRRARSVASRLLHTWTRWERTPPCRRAHAVPSSSGLNDIAMSPSPLRYETALGVFIHEHVAVRAALHEAPRDEPRDESQSPLARRLLESVECHL